MCNSCNSNPCKRMRLPINSFQDVVDSNASAENILKALDRTEQESNTAILRTQEFRDFINGEGLGNLVNESLEQKIADGSLANLIDEELLGTVNTEITTLNNTKANKTDVYLKSDGININDFDEATRQTFLEAQGIDVNYVLGEGAVEPINTSFMELRTSKNRYNPLTSVSGFISPSGGRITESSVYVTSDFIEVTERPYLVTNKEMRFIALYNSSKTIIPLSDSDGSNIVGAYALPPEVQFIRASFRSEITDIQIEFNTEGELTPYIPYSETTFKLKGEYLPNTNENSVLNGKKVAWLGTSITQSYNWCQMVNAYFNFNATNCGIAGSTITNESPDSMCNVTRLKTPSVGNAIPDDVEIIFIEGGTNDWARNHQLGVKEIQYSPGLGDISLNINTFQGASHQMLKNITSLYPNAKIILLGTPFGKLPNRNSFSNKYGLINNLNKQTVEYGDALIEVGSLWGVSGINLGRLMQVNDNNVNTIFPDGLHFTTNEANQRASKVIIDYLLTLKV